MLHITSNGSGKVLELSELEAVLATEPLDITFERYGNFILTRDGVTRFWGNFARVSHVFQIDTDEPEVIARLTSAIRANQETPAYLAQRPTRHRCDHAARDEHMTCDAWSCLAWAATAGGMREITPRGHQTFAPATRLGWVTCDTWAPWGCRTAADWRAWDRE